MITMGFNALFNSFTINLLFIVVYQIVELRLEKLKKRNGRMPFIIQLGYCYVLEMSSSGTPFVDLFVGVCGKPEKEMICKAVYIL